MTNTHQLFFVYVVVVMMLMGVGAFTADQPQWGEYHSRNMVSAEKTLPVAFDLASGKTILWEASLGSGTYGSPIIAQGRVFIGTNNADPRDPRHQGDRGVLLCLDEKDGSLQWQLVVPRIGGDDYLDWPGVGLCSPPTVEGERVYTVTNRGEVVCLDLKGLENGNDGPFLQEGRHSVPADMPELVAAPPDADIIWLFDMRQEIGMYPHDAAHSSILIDGRYLYLNTGNGVDNTHLKIGNPNAPSLIVLDKATGTLIATDREDMGSRIFHAVWAPPSLGEVGGRRLIFFGGPEGVVYAFQALAQDARVNTPSTLEKIWFFDCDPNAPKENYFAYSKNLREGPSQIVCMPVFYKNRVYVVAGGDIWWGKRQSWIKCIDASQSGEVTQTAEMWSYPIPRQCSSTPCIINGLLFVGDDAGNLHCVDAETGEGLWTHHVGRSIWGSVLGADGKVYIGARNGAFAILQAAREKQVLFETRFPDEINGTPTAANGVLYVATLSRLYAIKSN